MDEIRGLKICMKINDRYIILKENYFVDHHHPRFRIRIGHSK